MNLVTLFLRLVHIGAGVFWVGASLFSAFFLTPALAATGEAGQRMMGHMIQKGRMSVSITAAAILTVLAGATLYWRDSQGFSSPWTYSASGWGFGIGAVAALIGMVFGMIVGQNAKKLGGIAAAAQGKPSAEQKAAMQAAQRQMSSALRISTVALIIALACMATARYWGVG